MNSLRIRALLSAVILTVFAAGSAIAQDGSDHVPKEKLEKYASAYIEAQDVIEEYQEKVGAVKTEEEADRLRKAYSKELADAVRAEDLTIEEYNDITEAVQRDPELRQRASQMISKERQQQ